MENFVWPAPGVWVRADSIVPKQGERVLLKIRDENCPVVGYWGCGEWEVCTVNISAADCTYTDFVEIAGTFDQEDVTHWMMIPECDHD